MASQNKEKNSKTTVIIAVSVIAVVIIGIVVLVVSTRDPQFTAESKDAFAQCITENGAVMYGAYWCSHCKATKDNFGSSFQYINYVECDPLCLPDENGQLEVYCQGYEGQPDLCTQLGIEGYDTWIFEDGSRLFSEPTFEELAQKTGCEGVLVEA